MHEALERVETRDRAPRAAALQLDHAAPEIEGDEPEQRAKDRDAADPAQRHLTKLSPVSARRLLQHTRLTIRNGDATFEPLQFSQQLLFLDRLRGRIDLAWLLRADGCRDGEDEEEQCRSGDVTDRRENLRHANLPNFSLRLANTSARRSLTPCAAPVSQVAIVSRYAVFQPHAPEP